MASTADGAVKIVPKVRDFFRTTAYRSSMAFQLGKWFRPQSRVNKTGAGAPANPYRAAVIVPGLRGGCEQVQAVAGKVFLMNEAPVLPLAGCDATKCTCRFVRREDRREGPRRAADDGFVSTFVFDDERRKKRTRRRKDD